MRVEEERIAKDVAAVAYAGVFFSLTIEVLTHISLPWF